MKNRIDLNASYEALMMLLISTNNICVHGNKISAVRTVPHSGFGLFGPQIITGKVYQIDGGTEIYLHARPSIARIIFLSILICGSFVSLVLVLLNRCTPIFCLLITLFTIVRIIITVWETMTCLAQFSRSLSEKLM